MEVDDVARDSTSGSSDVAQEFLSALVRWTSVDRSTSPPALRTALHAWLRSAQAAQPSMALIHHMAARALAVIDTGLARNDSVADLRGHLAQSCNAEASDLATSRTALVQLALPLLTEREAWIATLSNSGVVRDAFLKAGATGREPRALIGEGRPLLEGRVLAAKLAAGGIPTWLVVDAALPLLVSRAHMVWLGADAVTDRGIINKVGSYALALAAREHSVPVYVLAQRRKFLPAATASLEIHEMPAQEVWDQAPPGVKPRNLYFELVPLELLRAVVTEDTVMGPSEARSMALAQAIPEELSAAVGR